MSEGGTPSKKGLGSKALKSLRRKVEKTKQKWSGESPGGDDRGFQALRANFDAQQADAARLCDEATRYVKAMEGLLEATHGFGSAIAAAAGSEWHGASEASENLSAITSEMSLCHNTLNAEVLTQLRAYVSLFPEHQKKLDKRERRRLDFDRSQRNVEHARQKGSKRLNELEHDHFETKQQFDAINTALMDSLPVFYDGRVPFYSQLFQSLFDSLARFHEVSAKSAARLSELHEDVLGRGTGMSGDAKRALDVSTPEQELNDPDAHGGQMDLTQLSTSAAPTRDVSSGSGSVPASPVDSGGGVGVGDGGGVGYLPVLGGGAGSAPNSPEALKPAGADAEVSRRAAKSPAAERTSSVIQTLAVTHPYQGLDEDELTLAKGDTVFVLPYPDPNDQDDGWLYGQCNGKEGVFPVNHTAACD